MSIFLQLATDDDIRQMVDDLITPENADTEASILVRLLSMTADRDDRIKDHVFVTASSHAFTKTTDFQEAYNKFVEPLAVNEPPNDVIHTGSRPN